MVEMVNLVTGDSGGYSLPQRKFMGGEIRFISTLHFYPRGTPRDINTRKLFLWGMGGSLYTSPEEVYAT